MSRTQRRRAKMMARIDALRKNESDNNVTDGPEVDVFFADDSRQQNPTRPGMGPLVAIGGINVPAEEVGSIGREIDDLCSSAGFPPEEEFKWSPGRELWMWKNLRDEARRGFFLSVLDILSQKDVSAVIVISDTICSTATGAETSEIDVTRMFLERVDQQCGRGCSQGFVVVDRPGGDRRDEETFLAECLETLQSGTKYVKPKHIAHNVISTPSNLSRLLQAADLVTGCTLSMVSGESQYALPVFDSILKLLDQSMGRIGGYGLKIHPDFKYANLYHWIAKDSHFWKGNCGHPMPLKGLPYYNGPFE